SPWFRFRSFDNDGAGTFQDWRIINREMDGGPPKFSKLAMEHDSTGGGAWVESFSVDNEGTLYLKNAESGDFTHLFTTGTAAWQNTGGCSTCFAFSTVGGAALEITAGKLVKPYGGMDLAGTGALSNEIVSETVDAAGASAFSFRAANNFIAGTDRDYFHVYRPAGNVFRIFADDSVLLGPITFTGGVLNYGSQPPSGSSVFTVLNLVPTNLTGVGGSILGFSNATSGTVIGAKSSTDTANVNIFGSAVSVNPSLNRVWSKVWAVPTRVQPTFSAGTRVHTEGGGFWFLGLVGTASSITNTFTDFYGAKIDKALASGSSSFNLFTNDYGIYVGERVDGGTIKNGIFLANATSGYKALVIRDQTTYMGSDAAGDLDLTGTNIDVNGVARIKAGGAASLQAKAGGTIFVSTSTEGHAAATETDACSQSIAASTLGTNGDSLEFAAAGTFAVGVTDQVKVKYGATTIFDTGALNVAGASSWSVSGSIIRTGATTQKARVDFMSSSAALVSSTSYTTPAETLSGAVTLKLTVNGTLANATQKEMCKGSWSSAP
ncbi:MAG: hypothetical protein ACREJC_08030, partial [Tepidisphaeraceae bacterium]